uniref:Putative secreted protein n=1 Tax=Ixodes scapularis TaxID=6945 RepID=A0A4D5RCF1_IXOSC
MCQVFCFSSRLCTLFLRLAFLRACVSLRTPISSTPEPSPTVSPLFKRKKKKIPLGQILEALFFSATTSVFGKSSTESSSTTVSSHRARVFFVSGGGSNDLERTVEGRLCARKTPSC